MENQPAPFHVRTLAVIGVGLIGGSVALALKRRNRVGRVIGVGRSRANLRQAQTLGAIDAIADDPAVAVAAADITVLATPVNALEGVLTAIAPAIDAHKTVLDVGSVKVGVMAAAAAALGPKIRRFVPCHPVAGKEHSGAAAAAAELFENHNVVLTPNADTAADALATAQRMWSAVGGRAILMSAQTHDRVLSVTSHLPHVLAYAMVDFFAADEDAANCYAMAAGGFYDFTRIASSDTEMWRDICLMNGAQILAHIDGFTQRLEGIAQLIKNADGDALEDLFVAAKKARARVEERRR